MRRPSTAKQCSTTHESLSCHMLVRLCLARIPQMVSVEPPCRCCHREAEGKGQRSGERLSWERSQGRLRWRRPGLSRWTGSRANYRRSVECSYHTEEGQSVCRARQAVGAVSLPHPTPLFPHFFPTPTPSPVSSMRRRLGGKGMTRHRGCRSTGLRTKMGHFARSARARVHLMFFTSSDHAVTRLVRRPLWWFWRPIVSLSSEPPSY